MRISKVTTKTGDKGKTELGDGKRVLKDHPVMVFIGEIDELNSHLGLAITASHDDLAGELRGIQQDLFNIGGEASMPGSDMELLPQDRVTFLERAIEKMNAELPSLKEFILPGGDEFCARLHVARAVCRRAERSCVTLMNTGVDVKSWLTFLNRLSDYLFVLVRYANKIQGGSETPWEREN
ncbi:MAG: cob(I)yrinic acid a,c-diamide adenosyltransferase [Candidatus Marinimicrobia bacterium]|jgi:cob(I)alamin adenosyltransferase|nr:cob(I)yrinic acid a,c-diamide adenosyltransferase [Candidatus Neomarinimicrobiota bacterium]MDP6610875.1 cob(I)yrinic acid a,c-diamide adenosyltransferase [Candidatus Neomarinimicrobiota bacterium]|tara:strand:+ start:7775 stop:8317 length:543 start_codon:yes stop_codon:yes gene_type:complete